LYNYDSRVDSRRALPLTIEEMKSFASEVLHPAWLSGDAQQIATALNILLERLRVKTAQAPDYLKRSASVAEFLQWIYDFDHISLEYGLRYGDTDLENLSPGTKGIVLLILYLIMDKDDKRPLIIDQPEENLDNESVYDLLVPHFRRAKIERQIILVSHNPNLVVNTDSEQVIFAQCERLNKHPIMTYQCGSLEDDKLGGIRDKICSTLEGGKHAFLRREQRYELGGEGNVSSQPGT
jgi:predicted ATPase